MPTIRQRQHDFERFLCFELAPDLTGSGLAAQLLNILDAAGVNKEYLVGQGDIFQAATDVYGGDITMPRLTARQRHRTNVPSTNAAHYYRRTVFLPFVDCCISQMTKRFSHNC